MRSAVNTVCTFWLTALLIIISTTYVYRLGLEQAVVGFFAVAFALTISILLYILAKDDNG